MDYQFSTSLLVKKTNTSPLELWGNATQLVVIVVQTSYDSSSYLVAYGVQPVPNSDSALVFEQLLPIDGLGAFLTYLIDGKFDPANAPGLPDSMLKLGQVTANSVDVTNGEPRPPGPQVAVLLTYASTITTSTSLAEPGLNG